MRAKKRLSANKVAEGSGNFGYNAATGEYGGYVGCGYS